MNDDATVSEAAGELGVHPRSLRRWIISGRLQAQLRGRVYRIGSASLARLKSRQERVRGWPRLVDVSRRLGIHRNLGESLCRAAGFRPRKDLSDDCRIPPEAEQHLERCVGAQPARRDWTRLADLAKELVVPRNTLDRKMRAQGLEFAADLAGHLILPPTSCERLRSWRRWLNAARAAEAMIDGQRVHSVNDTAAKAAEKFAPPGTEAHQAQTIALIHRYRYWARMGLPVRRLNRQLFVDDPTHRALVDDVCLAEASRLTGLKKDLLKRWAVKGLIPQTGIAPTRRSYSYAGIIAALAARMKPAPVSGVSHRVPVQTLPPWSELGMRLRLPKGASLARWLELAVEASREELHALETGAGCVSVQVWQTLDMWLRAAAASRLPPKPAIKHSQEQRAALAQAPELASLLAWFAGVGEEPFRRVLRVGVLRRVDTDELDAVCNQLASGGIVRVYHPEQTFHPGEFLLDVAGSDLGSVRSSHRHHLEVSWMRRGALRMRHYHQPPSGSPN